MACTELVLIDDQTVFRELLVDLLAANSRYRVVGHHASGQAGLEHCLRVRPALVILDVVLPDMNGLDVLERLRARVPRTRVVVITAHDQPAIVHRALRLGAHGVVMKGAPLRELIEALDRVAAGHTYYCSRSSEIVRRVAIDPPTAEGLTPRHREILIRVASGLSTKEIASDLGVSAKTVSNHRHELMRRLGLHDVASLTRYAVQQGLVEGRPPGATP